MTRSVEDLKALVTRGDEYRETITVEYLGETFAVPIRPLTETELNDVRRQAKVSMKLMQSIRNKVKVGEKMTPEEEQAAKEAAVDEIMKDESLNLGDVAYTNLLVNRQYCKYGIADEGLRMMVPKFRYGLTEMIAKRIQTISEVPPEVVANFFDPTLASNSS